MCGDSLFGDVHEYHQGGTEILEQGMHHRGARNVTASPYDPDSSNERYIFEPIRLIRQIFRNVRGAFGGSEDLSDISTQASRVGIAAMSTTTRINMPPLRVLHLLACVHQTQRRKNLIQDRIDMVETDRELFCFIKRRLKQLHSHARTLLRFRTVTGIHFTKVSSSFNWY
jgi:hypothetical protein